MTSEDYESGDRRCSRCRMRLSSHGKVWTDGNVKHYICPTARGHAAGEA